MLTIPVLAIASRALHLPLCALILRITRERERRVLLVDDQNTVE